MCLIIQREGKRARLPGSVVDYNGWLNPDGFGLAWREDGKLRHERYGPVDFKVFRDDLEELDKKRGEYVAHFRRATHGGKCVELAHPFSYEDPIEGKVLVFHNGIIDIDTLYEESDTEVFVRLVLAKLPSGWWRNPATNWLIEASTGWSRFAIMTATETVRLREQDWTKEKGIWYSTWPHRTAPPGKTPLKATSEKAGSGGDGFPIGTVIGKYRKVANDGAWARDDDTDDEVRAAFRETLTYRQQTYGVTWTDANGHHVVPINYHAGDTWGHAECDDCNGSGDWYKWDDERVIDITHGGNGQPIADDAAAIRTLLARSN